ncbi:hypothetical protein [Luteolibacter sp. LG18]|uniref:hypothetical protein n=1 Tax=Luteolibacter sp. LG18 TaxID=2819286 RepID=UPI002B2CCED8|nr:hypothetical protein llg_40550 [Luteolibacter sp. LG18]
MIDFQCNHCHAVIHARDDVAGMTAKCPHCRGEVVVPAASSAPGGMAGSPSPEVKRAARWGNSVLIVLVSTGIALAMVLAAMVMTDRSGATPAQIAGHSTVMLAGGVILAVLAGLVGAVVMQVYDRSFIRGYALTYSISAVVIAVMGVGAICTLKPVKGGSEAPEPVAHIDVPQQQAEPPQQQVRPEKRPAPEGIQLSEESVQTQRLGVMMKAYIKDLAAIAARHNDEREKSGIEKLFDAKRLFADKGFIESHGLLKKSRELLIKRKAEQEELLNEWPRRLDAAGITGDYKIKALETLNQSNGLRTLTVESYKMELQTLGHATNAVKFLEESKGRWIEKDGNLYFRTDADLKTFQDLMTKVKESAGQKSGAR